MKTETFFDGLDEPLLIAEIARAESGSTGEIRIFVSEHPSPQPLPAAEREFHRLGMRHTRDRNGVLIFIAPVSQSIAIVGDSAIHEKAGADFWQTVVDRALAHLRRGRPTEALVDAVRLIGGALRQHFPCDGPGVNELPDAIVRNED